MEDDSAAKKNLREEYANILRRRHVDEDLRKRPTITMLDAIAEMEAGDDGLHPPGYFDEARRVIREMPTTEGGQLQPLLESISAQIETHLDRLNIRLPETIYVGLFPLGAANAEVRAAKDGVLILVNAGLFMVIYQSLKVANLATRFTDWDSDGELVEHPVLRNLEITAQEVTSLLADIVMAYIEHGDSTKAARLAALGGVRGDLLRALVASCEIFTVAHEFAHVLQGHVTKRVAAAQRPEGGAAYSKPTRHREEFEADEIGASLLISELFYHLEQVGDFAKMTEAQQAQLRQLSDTTIAGPLIFFALIGLIDRVRQRLGLETTQEPEWSSHPSSSERAFKVRELIRSSADFDLSTADSYVQFFSEQTELIVQEALRRQKG
jgi:hypothetical protein